MGLKPLVLMPSRQTTSKFYAFLSAYQSVLLMLIAQLLSSLMSTAAKVLQTSTPSGKAGLPASEILFCMMTITAILSWIYLVALKIPSSPLGTPSSRPLLLLRGIAGAFGIWGYYYSLRFLPLAEATVINFLAPMIAALACALLLKTPFTRIQRFAGLFSILGVIFVAKPWHIVWPHEMICSSQQATPDPSNPNRISVMPVSFAADPATYKGSLANCTIDGRPVTSESVPTPLEHLLAISVALVGVAGGAASYVAISWLGKEAHPMISVWWFASCVSLLASLSFVVFPQEALRWPEGATEWVLLALQGVIGFAMHATLTASLACERSSRALNVVYAQIVFALLVDWTIWGVVPGPVSLIGGVLVLGSVVAVAVTKDQKTGGDEERGGDDGEGEGEEAVELMGGGQEMEEEEEEEVAEEVK